MSNAQPILILAALDGRTHVQVGKGHADYESGEAVYDRLDSAVSGYFRDSRGNLRAGGPHRDHFIDGQRVRFYRMRHDNGGNIAAEFGHVKRVPLSAIRLTNNKRSTTSMTSKTPSGIKRPTTAVFASWERARNTAKANNDQRGRGYRALKTANGKGYTVIFRPAVANNRQRANRQIV